MVHRFIVCAVLLLTGLSPTTDAAAQVAPPEPFVNRAPAPQSPTWVWQAADPLSPGARYACRRATSFRGVQPGNLRLCLEGRRAGAFNLILTRVAGNSQEELYNVSLYVQPQLALTLLADRRFEYFWPVLYAVGGEDGRQFRTNAMQTQLRETRLPPDRPTTFDSTIDEDLRRALAESQIWANWGERDRAMAILDRLIPRPNAEGVLSDRQQYQLLSIELRRMTNLIALRDVEGAEALLRRVIADTRIWDGYRVNAEVNLAALLADMGRPEEAIRVINSAQRRFDASDQGAVGGSDRQFAWIRACALHQLGAERDARTELATVRLHPVTMPNGYVIESAETINIRVERCMASPAPQVRRMNNWEQLGVPLPSPEWAQLIYASPRVRAAAWEAEIYRLSTGDDGPATTIRALPANWAWLANDRGRFRDAAVQ